MAVIPMNEGFGFVDPNADFDENNPIRPDAERLEGSTLRGKPCVLINNTGRCLPREDLADILRALIENDRFGFRTLSAAGGNAIEMARRESTHVQIGDDLYRLIVFRYEARIENF